MFYVIRFLKTNLKLVQYNRQNLILKTRPITEKEIIYANSISSYTLQDDELIEFCAPYKALDEKNNLSDIIESKSIKLPRKKIKI